MKKLKYAVIVLNYNTAEDCQLAVQSIKKNALGIDYRICIVDSGSSNEDEKYKLKKLESEDVELLFLEENVGYARGNNAAVKYLLTKYQFEYTVIMNPDVIIEQVGTIEGLIDSIQKYNMDIVGAQPLVAGMDTDIPANMQINIRKVFTYSDMLINASWVLKRIFKKKFNESVYFSERPYNSNIVFEVPSGAFFLINTDIFERVGFFDESTFLYAEELILGYKLKKLGKKFLFVPKFKVLHFQGKSTQSHKENTTDVSRRYAAESKKIYMQKYLKVNPIMIKFYQWNYCVGEKSEKIFAKICYYIKKYVHFYK